MVMTMADFPPNPEDGELWIPSEIIHEITSANGTVSPPKHTVLSHHPPRPTLPPVAPNFQVIYLISHFHILFYCVFMAISLVFGLQNCRFALVLLVLIKVVVTLKLQVPQHPVHLTTRLHA